MDVQGGPGFTVAGWYQDPAGRHQLRYWDGLAWRDDVVDNGRQSTDPLLLASPPQTCENCQRDSSPGKRVIYYAGRQLDRRQLGVGAPTLIEITYRVLQRSSVFLCERCAKSPSKTEAAIKRKMAGSGLDTDSCWLADYFAMRFGAHYLKNTSYARIRDIMQDDLATTQAASDAALVFHWMGLGAAGIPMPPKFEAAIEIAVDDVADGFGSLKGGFSALVRVPAGVHRVSIVLGSRSCHAMMPVEPGGAYEADMAYNPRFVRGLGFGIKRMS